jgi:hypothetical protein
MDSEEKNHSDSPWKNLLNRSVTIEVTKHQMRRNGLRMRFAAQEVLQNGKRIEMSDEFQKRFNLNKLFYSIAFVNKIMMLNGYATLWHGMVK